MRNLMRGSEYYSIRKGTMQSLYGAYQQGSVKDFWDRERTRMLPMDVSDIAYDAFWINGKAQQELTAKPGERIRLRVINAGASTYFYLHSAFPQMTIIAADGNDVKPLSTQRLLMGMGETYDVLVTMPASGRYEVRATAQDISGSASLWLGSGTEHRATDIPRPNYYSMDHMLNQALEIEGSEKMHGSPYRNLRALQKTHFAKGHTRREIELHLTGDMERYRWSFNNKTLFEESTIPVKRGEVLRIKLINDSMMHHPIHLHRHFFRMINEEGEYSPLKHTVDIPPMGSRTIEFLANEYGDWIFHCHLLYHMDAGMTRIISYDDQGADHKPNVGPGAREPWYPMVDGMIQNNMTMGMASIM
jgi:FtsP/CotA-like multicopper oxidase with cupredoxin domain